MENTPQFLSKDSSGQTRWQEWIARIGIIGAIIFCVCYFMNYIGPFVESALEHTWSIIALAAPLALLIVFVLRNPLFIPMAYATICRKIVNSFIKMDPLSFMDRRRDLLKDRLVSAKKTKEDISAQKIALERKMKDLKADGESHWNLAQAAKKLGRENQAASQSSMALQDKQSIELYMPIYNKFTTGLAFLDKLTENWELAIEQLSFTIDRKREEYFMLKKMAKAMHQAEEFASGDTESARMYNESIKALEQKVTGKMSYIDEFQKNTKGLMEQMDLEKIANNQSALDALNENENLFIDTDFFKAEPITMEQDSNGTYTMPANAGSGKKSKYSDSI